MTAPLIAVCDYGIGNLHSAHKALARHGADARLTADRGLIADAAAVVLPGVGAFGACMDALRATGLEDPVRDAIAAGRPFLGICIGTQMLFDDSEEDRGSARTRRDPGDGAADPGRGQAPRRCSGTRSTSSIPTEQMFAGLDVRPWFYFVHSLHGVPADPAVVVATCDYGGPVNAAFRLGNVFATQFHPEKSRHRRAAPVRQLRRLVRAVVMIPRPSCTRRSTCAAGASSGCGKATSPPRPCTATTRSSIATSFCEQGAQWIHVVDLDAARTGEPRNRDLVTEIVVGVAGRHGVQAGGGVRTAADAAALADVGRRPGGDGFGRPAPPRPSSTRWRRSFRSPSGSITAAACSPWTAGRSRATSR